MDDDFLASIIVEIFDGVSVSDSSIGPIFIKHFLQLDARRFFARRPSLLQEAKKMGLQGEKEGLSDLIKAGLWDPVREDKVQQQTLFLEKLQKSLSKIKLPSQKKNHRLLIEREEKKLNTLSLERSELLGLTAERYVDNRINRDFFDSIMFLDKDFSQPVFEQIELGQLELEKEMRDIQSEFFKRVSDDNISKASLSSHFAPYFGFSEDSINLFGEPLKNLTAFQLKLITYSRNFLNIFKNCPKQIPDSVSKDPELLIDFYEAAKNNSSSKKGEGSSGAGGTTYFGATESDIEDIKDGENTVKLSDEIKKKGGSLNMQDFIALHKQN